MAHDSHDMSPVFRIDVAQSASEPTVSQPSPSPGEMVSLMHQMVAAQDRQNELMEDKPDFLTEAMFYQTKRYYIPYRSLYSKDISNLFMAGRCFSCSHIGLGGPRVMRTTGQMGAAVGYAAALCKEYQCLPGDIYNQHLEQYMQLVKSSGNGTTKQSH